MDFDVDARVLGVDAQAEHADGVPGVGLELVFVVVRLGVGAGAAEAVEYLVVVVVGSEVGVAGIGAVELRVPGGVVRHVGVGGVVAVARAVRADAGAAAAGYLDAGAHAGDGGEGCAAGGRWGGEDGAARAEWVLGWGAWVEFFALGGGDGRVCGAALVVAIPPVVPVAAVVAVSAVVSVPTLVRISVVA